MKNKSADYFKRLLESQRKQSTAFLIKYSEIEESYLIVEIIEHRKGKAHCWWEPNIASL